MKGVKRHIGVDKNGSLIAVMVTVANIHDSKAAYLLMRVLKELCSGIKVILADGGYRGELIQNVKNKFGYVIRWLLAHTKNRDSNLFTKDGLWKEHFHGWKMTGGSAETMN